MKTKFLFLTMIVCVALSCDNKPIEEITPPQEGNEEVVPAPISEGEKYLNDVMAQCENWDAETLIQGLVGVWEVDSIYQYDEEWNKIVDIPIYDGDCQYLRTGYETFTFTADGKGNNCMIKVGPYDPEVYHFSWNYDAENRTLTLDGEYNSQWKVVGFNNEYFIIDFVTVLYHWYEDPVRYEYIYFRYICKRKVE